MGRFENSRWPDRCSVIDANRRFGTDLLNRPGSAIWKQSRRKGSAMMRALILGMLTLAIVVAPVREIRADQVFDFSFSNLLGTGPQPGNVNGTVTGEIVLPFDGDGMGAAKPCTSIAYRLDFRVSAPCLLICSHLRRAP